MLSNLEHLSYSSVNLYTMCAAAWKFRYLDKVQTPRSINLVFGATFHDAIETAIANYNAPGRAIIKPLTTYWENAWNGQLNDGQEVDWQGQTQEEIFSLGIKMLSAKPIIEMIQEIKPFDTESIEQKMELWVPGVPIPIIGYIDIIERDGVPADFKTSARTWGPTKALEELQPCFYLAAMNQAGWQHNPQFRFRHYVFIKTKVPKAERHESNRTPAELFRLFKLIQDVWAGISAGVFPATGTGWKCTEKYCEYWPFCKGKN